MSNIPELNFSFGSALRETIKRFGLKANWLSEKSTVPKQTISAFLNGHQQIQSGNLEKLLAVLPFEAKQYYFSLLLGQSPQRPSLVSIVESLDPNSDKDCKEAADVMRMISQKFILSRRSTDEPRELALIKSP